MGLKLSRELDKYRKEIADIDSQILELAKARLSKAQAIGVIKKQQNVPVIDLKVEADVIDRSKKIARAIGLDEAFAARLVGSLIAEAVELQKGASESGAQYLYDIFEKVKALEAKGEKIIRFDLGEPDLSSPIELKDALKEALYGSSFIGYVSTKGIPELRQAIADDLNQTYGVDLNSEQVLITPGGKFGIFLAIISKVSLGDHVVIPEPAWPVYGNCVRLVKGRVDALHTRFEDSWDIDIDEFEETLSVNPKLFVLCSPSNPTGKVISGKALHEMVQLAKKKGTYILADEVYCAYSGVPFESILQVTDSNFIYANSFSKRYGMTGWRIGYAVSDVETITRMQSLLQVSVTCVSEFVQRAAIRALEMRQDPFTAFAEEMVQRINTACRELDQFPLSYVRPDGGMYVFPRAKAENFNSYDFALKLLDEERVGVTPGVAFGDYPEHFRISLGTNMTDIRAGIRKIGEAISRWESG